MYPAGFYLVKPFDLLNKDVLNKDNLSSNEAKLRAVNAVTRLSRARVPHRRPREAAGDAPRPAGTGSARSRAAHRRRGPLSPTRFPAPVAEPTGSGPVLGVLSEGVRLRFGAHRGKAVAGKREKTSEKREISVCAWGAGALRPGSPSRRGTGLSQVASATLKFYRREEIFGRGC